MTPELLSSTAAIFLSLLFSYIPGFSSWYEPLSPTLKRLVMLALLLLVSVGSFALACTPLPISGGGVGGEGLTCDLPGAWGLLRVFIASLIANQSTYLISPKSKSSA